ncbi:vacuolar ABC heavy metal transporter [Trichophyton rubrum]|uniref:Vacuolar ABC heavy metal transporter n=3 Tax=Trichophyton rubrum TaxID=5551 RepID=A0A178F5Z1_TRIRU|nr:P-loop containing nucleoside triphosphate hydrolase [Trichophyton rubrum]OAL67749.1 vacuolar ABC heavy metal transporter [Trichophyton rubrum]
MGSVSIDGLGLAAHQMQPIRRTLDTLHNFSPVILFVVFAVAFVTNTIIANRRIEPKAQHTKGARTGPGGRPLPTRMRSAAVLIARKTPDFSPATKLAFKWLAVGVLFSFIAEAAIHVAHIVLHRKDHWWCGQAVVIHVVGTFFVHTLVLISLIDTTPSPTVAQLITWIVSMLLELVILALFLDINTSPHHEPVVGDPLGGPLRKGLTTWEAGLVVTASARILLLVSLVVIYSLTSYALKAGAQNSGTATETTSLLHSGNGTAHANGDRYGASHRHLKHDDDDQPEEDGWVRPKTLPSTSWWEYMSGYSLFFPYLWPSRSTKLKSIVVFCFFLVILQRGVNLGVPMLVRNIVNILAQEHGNEFYVPWGTICLYVIFRSLQGSQGLIGSLRSFLWIPVGQYSYMELSTAAFEHVHSLSLDFHLGKKTGEVLSALGKGSSINGFLEQVTFQVVPMLVDMCIAVGYFFVEFDVYYALVVGIITFLYLYLTIRMAQWRGEVRRMMTNADRQQDAVKNDSMVSYETVKYFNAEPYEFNRYRGAVSDYQAAEYHVLFSLQLMNTCQNTVFMLGLLITCFICAFQIANGQRDVGQFVGLLTYMSQLQGPLNFFGTFYRSIQGAMINSERLLELFRAKPTVVDAPDVDELRSCNGGIEFDKVHFAYDSRKPALNGLSFECKPGTTTALVGESGGGKSTVFRLLFRFYNSTSGQIRVDGHPVESVSIDSLRRHIGVVPQDTVLFNETIMYNLKYANPGATDEDIYDACRAASIHDRILTFPDGYQTKVGERGLRLSGGEKQRVAIARTIIKNPRIILLDEATAALDTDTEEHIQGALATLSKGRTMLVIAHRLSTITTADQILVLQNGQVAEKGTHEQLLAMKGRYSSMWRKQIKAQRAAAEAQVLQDRAERLRSSSVVAGGGEDSSSQSDEDRHAETTARPRPTLSQRSTKASEAKPAGP